MPRPKENVREATAQETRRLLLEAAIREFSAVGFEGANVNRISEAAGFAKGTVYNYFHSKRDLMLAVLDAIAKLQREAIEPAVRQHADADQRLRAFFAAGFAFAEQWPHHSRVVIEALYGPDMEFRQHLYQEYLWMLSMMSEDILRHGIDQGRFRAVDVASTTALLLTIYLGGSGPRDEAGRIWLNAEFVTQFALSALASVRKED